VKVSLIGAGSVVFARTLMGDLLTFPELADGTTVALMDIDEERLRVSELAARRIVDMLGVNTRIEATLDRRAALDGADYVMTMFQVGGYRPATVTDFEVPKRFGLRQTIGDTLGVGGITCVADARGITPQPVGALPPQLAALIQTNVNVQGLTVEAALSGGLEHVYHAAMLDPHTAAELPLAEIRELVDAMLEAHGDLIPSFTRG
jgi:alpha-galactosidase/6-phospho-beta-glucosidase family protein